MITCFMYGSYSSVELGAASSDRTKQAMTVIHEMGGKEKGMYAMLGDNDLVFIVDFPDITTALKTSVALTKITEIVFSSVPAVTVEEFDAIIDEL